MKKNQHHQPPPPPPPEPHMPPPEPERPRRKRRRKRHGLTVILLLIILILLLLLLLFGFGLGGFGGGGAGGLQGLFGGRSGGQTVPAESSASDGVVVSVVETTAPAQTVLTQTEPAQTRSVLRVTVSAGRYIYNERTFTEQELDHLISALKAEAQADTVVEIVDDYAAQNAYQALTDALTAQGLSYTDGTAEEGIS